MDIYGILIVNCESPWYAVQNSKRPTIGREWMIVSLASAHTQSTQRFYPSDKRFATKFVLFRNHFMLQCAVRSYKMEGFSIYELVEWIGFAIRLLVKLQVHTLTMNHNARVRSHNAISVAPNSMSVPMHMMAWAFGLEEINKSIEMNEITYLIYTKLSSRF